MSKHTPGPWTRDQYGHIVDADGKNVRFRSVTIHMSGSREDTANAEANTDLIAAAPDLLGAAKKALGVLHGDDMSKQSLIDAMQACVDAIKKAEGSK